MGTSDASVAADRSHAPELLGRSQTGLNFAVARSLADVEEAWELVHNAFVRSGAIQPHPAGIYTAPQAIGTQALVIVARLVTMPVGTLTAILDGPHGFTLDAAFASDMEALRACGRHPMELCLFADRRASISRSFFSLLEMTRYVFHFAIHAGVTDFVTAVPTDHVSFYVRYFAFERAGRRDAAPLLHGKPSCLLRLPVAERLAERPLPPEVEYYTEKPVAAGEFEQRYAFPSGELAGSNIAHFLQNPA